MESDYSSGGTANGPRGLNLYRKACPAPTGVWARRRVVIFPGKISWPGGGLAVDYRRSRVAPPTGLVLCRGPEATATRERLCRHCAERRRYHWSFVEGEPHMADSIALPQTAPERSWWHEVTW